jgi:hypothetical protein
VISNIIKTSAFYRETCAVSIYLLSYRSRKYSVVVARMAQKLKNLAYEGFGVGLGFLAALAVYMVVGLLFFIPGFFLFQGEKGKLEKNTVAQGTGIVLMVIGVIIMGGAGLSVLLDSLGDVF